MSDSPRPAAARSVLARPLRVLIAVAVMVAAAALGAVPVGAQTATAGSTSAGTDPSVASLRADADAIATRYFAALTRANELDDEITQNEAVVADLEARAARARTSARDRAVVAYRQSGSRLAAVIDGGDVLDAARRVRIIDQVNHQDLSTYTRLEKVTQDLQDQRHTLQANRAAHADALATLQTESAAIDAKLADAARRDQAQVAAAAAGPPPPPPRATPSTTATPATTAPVAPTVAPTTPAPTAPPSTPAPPPDYVGSPGVHPNHDDPFLACVRQRESGGSYTAVSPSGAYRGAYQFSQSTWNATANHARRTELIGVPPNLATPYDQDDMAWTLYQWQGPGPWGGSCG